MVRAIVVVGDSGRARLWVWSAVCSLLLAATLAAPEHCFADGEPPTRESRQRERARAYVERSEQRREARHARRRLARHERRRLAREQRAAEAMQTRDATEPARRTRRGRARAPLSCVPSAPPAASDERADLADDEASVAETEADADASADDDVESDAPRGDDGSKDEVAAVESDVAEDSAGPAIALRGSLDWLSSLGWTAPTESVVDPDNAVLHIPRYTCSVDLRPNVRLEIGSFLQAIAQPRFVTSLQVVHVDGERLPLARSTRAQILQLYATLALGDVLSLSYGYQTFQWGPAELLTPSNRLFRVVGLTRDPLFVVPGRNLARANLSIGRTVSLIALAELLPNGDRPFTAGERFARQGLLKLEYSTDDGAAYAGITGGFGQRTRPWVGEYGSWSVTEALAIYADATHARGSRALYPTTSDEGTLAFAATQRDARRLRTLAIAGARYTFTDGTDLRGEYVYHDAGYTDGQLRLAQTIAASRPPDAQRLAAYDAPGLDLLARHAVYASTRIPDLPPHKRVTLQLRYLLSLSDRGGTLFGTVTVDLGDSLVLFASGLYAHGASHAESARFARAAAALGLVYSL